jgi:hypothetical protein
MRIFLGACLVMAGVMLGAQEPINFTLKYPRLPRRG